MLYLAYGSNLHPIRLTARVPSATLLGKTILHNRVLRFHKRSMDGSAKCNIVRAAGSVHAAVYRISAEEKPGLDHVEGLGAGYRIETLNLTGYGSCYTYVALESQIDESLKPYSWYKELVMIGCRSLQFPQRYLEQVMSVDCIEDPDRVRHDQNMQIVSNARRARTGYSGQGAETGLADLD